MWKIIQPTLVSIAKVLPVFLAFMLLASVVSKDNRHFFLLGSSFVFVGGTIFIGFIKLMDVRAEVRQSRANSTVPEPEEPIAAQDEGRDAPEVTN